jgi:hypothetical protein
MTGPSKKALAGHHLTEAIKHLTSAAEFIRELPDRDDDVLDHMALVVEGAVETVRDVRGHVEADAPHAIRGRTPRKPDRRAGDRRASKRRVDDKRKAALSTKGSR